MAIDDLSRDGELRRRRLLMALLLLGFLVVSLLVSDERRLFGGRAMPQAFAALATAGPPRASTVTFGFGVPGRPPAAGARRSLGPAVPTGAVPARVPGAPAELAGNGPEAVVPQSFDSGDAPGGVGGPDGFQGGGFGGGGGGGGGFGGGGGGGLVPEVPGTTLPGVPATPGMPSSDSGVVIAPTPEAPVAGVPIPAPAPPAGQVRPPQAPDTLPGPDAPPLAPADPPAPPVSPVPEPATWLVLTIGCGAIATALRRVRRVRRRTATALRQQPR